MFSFVAVHNTPHFIQRTQKTVTKRPYLSIRSFCWWERVDSDHRSETQQIYSLPPLATRERSHDIKLLRKNWSWWTDSNPRPADYKSAALPTELHQLIAFCRSLTTSILYHKLLYLSSVFLKNFKVFFKKTMRRKNHALRRIFQCDHLSIWK